jgi:hypothetical protein
LLEDELELEPLVLLQHGQEQVLLRREVMQQSGSGQPGVGRDRLDRGTPETAHREDEGGGIEDLGSRRHSIVLDKLHRPIIADQDRFLRQAQPSAASIRPDLPTGWEEA